jgi:hypothetical protein
MMQRRRNKKEGITSSSPIWINFSSISSSVLE